MSEYSSQIRRALSLKQRLAAMLLGIGIVVVFGIAVCLRPDSRGFGTHQQLGLPACTFRSMTGVNCPHCGLTTSFCWFVRGDILRSMQANPAGMILAGASLVILSWSFVVGIRGRSVITHEPGRDLLVGFGIWVLLSIVIWLYRLYWHQI